MGKRKWLIEWKSEECPYVRGMRDRLWCFKSKTYHPCAYGNCPIKIK